MPAVEIGSVVRHGVYWNTIQKNIYNMHIITLDVMMNTVYDKSDLTRT